MPIANFFRRPHYTSDATQFLNELKAQRPWLDAAQQQGRALLWDKEIDHQQQADTTHRYPANFAGARRPPRPRPSC